MNVELHKSHKYPLGQVCIQIISVFMRHIPSQGKSALQGGAGVAPVKPRRSGMCTASLPWEPEMVHGGMPATLKVSPSHQGPNSTSLTTHLRCHPQCVSNSV